MDAGMLHSVVPDGHPSKYYPTSTLLNFNELATPVPPLRDAVIYRLLPIPTRSKAAPAIM